MDADRIDVFHIADRNGRIVVVADHLVFDLLIPLDALLDQHLMHRGEGKRIAHHLAQLRLVVGEAGTGDPLPCVPPVPPSVKAGRNTTG